MKFLTTNVQCRGCQTGVTVECEVPGFFGARGVMFRCKKCGSKNMAEIRRAGAGKIETRVKMVEHTQTLLNLMKRRGIGAKSKSKE